MLGPSFKEAASYPHSLPRPFSLYSIIRSEEVLLPTCAGVRVEVPLDIAIFVFERTAANLEGSKAHTWPYLTEFAGIIGSPDEHMMPDLYDIIHILEGNDSAALRFAFSRWQGRKQVLEHFHNSLANWRGEPLHEITSATIRVQHEIPDSTCPTQVRMLAPGLNSYTKQKDACVCEIDPLPDFRIPAALCRCVGSNESNVYTGRCDILLNRFGQIKPWDLTTYLKHKVRIAFRDSTT